jgi:hypothetical protein
MLDEMKILIAQSIREAIIEAQPKMQDEWIKAPEAQKILKCKICKLRDIRDRGLITTSRIGRSVFYHTPSIYEYLRKNSGRPALQQFDIL